MDSIFSVLDTLIGSEKKEESQRKPDVSQAAIPSQSAPHTPPSHSVDRGQAAGQQDASGHQHQGSYRMPPSAYHEPNGPVNHGSQAQGSDFYHPQSQPMYGQPYPSTSHNGQYSEQQPVGIQGQEQSAYDGQWYQTSGGDSAGTSAYGGGHYNPQADGYQAAAGEESAPYDPSQQQQPGHPYQQYHTGYDSSQYQQPSDQQAYDQYQQQYDQYGQPYDQSQQQQQYHYSQSHDQQQYDHTQQSSYGYGGHDQSGQAWPQQYNPHEAGQGTPSGAYNGGATSGSTENYHHPQPSYGQPGQGNGYGWDASTGSHDTSRRTSITQQAAPPSRPPAGNEASQGNDDFDDLGLGNKSLSAGKRKESVSGDKDGEDKEKEKDIDESKKKAAAGEFQIFPLLKETILHWLILRGYFQHFFAAQANQQPGSKWLPSWLSWSGSGRKEDGGSARGKKAHLGEENSFVYDPELKRWVNKKDLGSKDSKSTSSSPAPPSDGAFFSYFSFFFFYFISAVPNPLFFFPSDLTKLRQTMSANTSPAPPPSGSFTPRFDGPPPVGPAPPPAVGAAAPPAGMGGGYQSSRRGARSRDVDTFAAAGATVPSKSMGAPPVGFMPPVAALPMPGMQGQPAVFVPQAPASSDGSSFTDSYYGNYNQTQMTPGEESGAPPS
jgi:hypothetical protein